ncbi:hypothetical protein Daus18300_014554 [Diaporthe australafricana]|uniref:Uncharacterized protein n=1 Tax=Diaporthe australafricana TaxID=127596 RepID=A0ABR3VUQ8_9PEZI
MDRNQPAAAANLLDQEGRIIAEILRSYRDLVNFATEPITNKTSTGQASYNSMAMDLETQNLIKSVENLLSLTRRIRELWIVGALRKPGEGDRTEETIESEVQKVVGIFNQLRSNKRQQLVSEGGGYGQFEVGELTLPTHANGPGAPGSTSAATNGAAPQTHGVAGELSTQLDEDDATETGIAVDNPELIEVMTYLLALAESYHEYLASPDMILALREVVISSMEAFDTQEETKLKGIEFVVNASGVSTEWHSSNEASMGRDESAEDGDSMMTLAALKLGTLDATMAVGEIEDDDAVLPSPVDDLTRGLVQAYTAPSPEGKSLMEDFEDAMISPTDPPESFRAEMGRWAEDTAADQRADDSQLPATTDEPGESCSSVASPSLFEGEAVTGDSSTDLSPQSASVTKNDETSGEEHDGEPPLLTE